MSRYIDAEKCKEALLRYGFRAPDMTVTELIEDECETEDVEKVIHSRYVHLGGDEWGCPVCCAVVHTEGSWDRPSGNYCSECGARMDGDEK